MNKKNHLVFIQPVLTNYRIPLFQDLSEQLSGRFTVYADLPSDDFGVSEYSGFEFKRVSWKKVGPIIYMTLSDFVRMWRQGSHFIHYGDFKCTSLWLLLFLSLFSTKKVFLHGQGGYKKKGSIATLVYALAVALSSGYIAYTKWSADVLRRRLPAALRDKVDYVNNSLYLDPVDTPPPATAKDILFIGRLREGSNIEMLLKAADELGLKVHVIGAGVPDYERKLKERYPDHAYYGAVYDWEKQKTISRNCYVGVYPGDAGLSVVSYLALGLPVVVHDDMESHMGPEPSYINNDVGLFFLRNNCASLKIALVEIGSSSSNRMVSKDSLNLYSAISGSRMAYGFLKLVLRRMTS